MPALPLEHIENFRAWEASGIQMVINASEAAFFGDTVRRNPLTDFMKNTVGPLELRL